MTDSELAAAARPKSDMATDPGSDEETPGETPRAEAALRRWHALMAAAGLDPGFSLATALRRFGCKK